MRLTHLTLRNFRNYESLELPLDGAHHLLLGQNGEGKTNVLEAIHMLGTGSSMRPARDVVLVRHGALGYEVGGRFESDRDDRAVRAEVLYDGGKKMRIDKSPARASDLLATIKVVSFAPSDVELIQDGGQVRRRFLDMMGCQLSAEYMKVLRDYQRAIKQRNETLAKSFVYSRGKAAASLAREPWDDRVIEFGADLVQRREDLVGSLASTLQGITTDAFRGGGPVSAVYEPHVQADGTDLRSAFAAALAAAAPRDEAVGYTTAGPHKDDVRLELRGQPLRTFGSLGQQQLSAMFLKLAQADLVRTQVGATPILLVDEMFAVLDRRAAEEFLERVEGEGQILLATAQEGWLGELRSRNFQVHNVTAGSIDSEPVV